MKITRELSSWSDIVRLLFYTLLSNTPRLPPPFPPRPTREPSKRLESSIAIASDLSPPSIPHPPPPQKMIWLTFPKKHQTKTGLWKILYIPPSTAIQITLTTTSNPFPSFSYLWLQHPSRWLSQNAPVAECIPRFATAGFGVSGLRDDAIDFLVGCNISYSRQSLRGKGRKKNDYLDRPLDPHWNSYPEERTMIHVG